MSRGHHVMKNISQEQIDYFLRNIETKNTDPYIKEIKILERDETGFPTQYYTVSKIPMMTDRESIMSMKRFERDGKVCYIIKTIERDDIPRTDKRIRMEFFKGVEYTKMEGGGLHGVEFIKFDLGGFFPISVLNML